MVNLDKISYEAFWFDGLKCEDDVRRVARTLGDIGYKGVDFKDLCFDTSIYSLDKMLEFAVKGAAKEGLQVPCCNTLQNHCSDNWKVNATKTSEFIKMCANAGVKLVNTMIGSAPAKIPGPEWFSLPRHNTQKGWDALKGSLEILAKTAEECDVHVVLEGCAGQLAHDYFTMREVFRQFDSERLCLTMDPSHDAAYDNDIPWAIRQWGKDKIRHVHLKDSFGMAVHGRTTPFMGEGSVDWEGFFEAMDEIGYDGWYSVEFESWMISDRISIEEAARISYRCTEAVIQKALSHS